MLNSIADRRRSASLNNICDEQSIVELPSSETSSQVGNRTRALNLLNKLHTKLSKSNSDLTAHPAINVEITDSNTLEVPVVGNTELHKQLFSEVRDYKKTNTRELRKQLFTELQSYKFKKRNRPEISSTGNLSAPQNERIGDISNLSDHSLGSDEIINSDDNVNIYDYDETDGSVLVGQEIEKLYGKIEKTKEEIMRLQAIRDENVSDYLKTTDNSAETGSNSKVKTNFERSNQKTNASISISQKKLEKYQQQLKDLESGVHGSKNIIKVVQDSVRSGASSISDAVSKPLESFSNFKIRSKLKEKKTSSAENVYITVTDDDETEHNLMNTSDEEYSSFHSLTRAEKNEKSREMISWENTNNEIDGLKSRVKKLETENDESKQSVAQLKERLSWATQSLKEESYKTQQLQTRLNELLNQWNDLTELHQNEMMGMKSEMDRTLEHIECVEYRFGERTADLEETLENCITKISKVEKQQQDQQQPIENFLDMDAKLLLSKCLSFIINISFFIIFLINTVRKMAMPFLSSRSRMVASVIVLVVVIIIWQNYDDEYFSTSWLSTSSVSTNAGSSPLK